MWIMIRRTSSRLFRCVMFDCAPMHFPCSHLHPLWRSLSHDRLGMPMEEFWIPVDDSFKKAYVEEWVFQVTDTSELSLSGGQGDVIPETPKVSLPVSTSPCRTRYSSRTISRDPLCGLCGSLQQGHLLP